MSNRVIRCCALILDEAKESVLLIQHRNKYGELYYWLPGGGLEDNESPYEGIKRELFEELGIKVDLEDYFILENILPNRHYKKYYTFIGTMDKATNIDIKNNDTIEIVGYKWFCIKDKDNYDAELYNDDIYPFIKELEKILNT